MLDGARSDTVGKDIFRACDSLEENRDFAGNLGCSVGRSAQERKILRDSDLPSFLSPRISILKPSCFEKAGESRGFCTCLDCTLVMESTYFHILDRSCTFMKVFFLCEANIVDRKG